MTYKRVYAGYYSGGWAIFRSAIVPTAETHGYLYAYVVGPFRTRRGADYFVAHPECQTVHEAERMAKAAMRDSSEHRYNASFCAKCGGKCMEAAQ